MSPVKGTPRFNWLYSQDILTLKGCAESTGTPAGPA